MNKIVNVAVVGLGQVGNYLYNELIIKKKDIELKTGKTINVVAISCLLYTSPSPRDGTKSRMPSSA